MDEEKHWDCNEKSNYNIAEFDIKENQANLKKINETNKKMGSNYKYHFNQHRSKIMKFCSKNKAIDILNAVENINSWALQNEK